MKAVFFFAIVFGLFLFPWQAVSLVLGAVLFAWACQQMIIGHRMTLDEVSKNQRRAAE